MADIKHIEIAGLDGPKLKSFYSDLFNWQFNRREITGFDYFDAAGEDSPSLGIRHEPEGHPEIVLYVEVEDLDASVEQAKKLGAAVRIPPMQYGELSFALIQDPEGNPIGLTEAPQAGLTTEQY